MQICSWIADLHKFFWGLSSTLSNVFLYKSRYIKKCSDGNRSIFALLCVIFD